MPILTLDDILTEELGGSDRDAHDNEPVREDLPPFPYPVFDLHCDTADRIAWASLPASLKAATGLAAYGPGDEGHPAESSRLARNRGHISLDRIGGTPWVQCFATFIPDELSPRQALEFWQHVSSYLATEIEANAPRIACVQPGEAISSTLAPSRTVAVPTIENARMLALDPALAHELAEADVRMASLSWNAAGPLASGHDTLDGITQAGRAALTELCRAGIVIDVSHLNDVSFADVAAATDAPLVASHSNSRAICPAPRNLTDAQFAEIRERKGLVGINFCRDFLAERDAGMDDIARHIEHFLDLGGEDILALGSDFDGCDVPACIADASHMPDFQRGLVHFFGEELTRKICGANALAFFDRRAL